jgi:hypothetical protein
VNQDCIAQVILDQQYVNGHGESKMPRRTGLDARNSVNQI